jgi:hypothetical protein
MTGSGRKREKKRGGERMIGIAPWRIFDFALLHLTLSVLDDVRSLFCLSIIILLKKVA